MKHSPHILIPLLLALASTVHGQSDFKIDAQLIDIDHGGLLMPYLSAGDLFGSAVDSLGDLDGDGIGDLVVGAPGDSQDNGAVWILFLDERGGVRDYGRISITEFSAESGGARFGAAVATIGDLNGDNVVDLAVGAPGSTNGDKLGAGAVWIVFLAKDGSRLGNAEPLRVDADPVIADSLAADDNFGSSLAVTQRAGESNRVELAIGAAGFAGMSVGEGMVWIVSVDKERNVDSGGRIASKHGGLDATIRTQARFGSSIAALTRAEDGQVRLAVGAPGTKLLKDYGGAFWLITLNEERQVESELEIDASKIGLGALIGKGDQLGSSIVQLSNGASDTRLAVGAKGADEDSGTTWILTLNSADEVVLATPIGANSNDFEGPLGIQDAFGSALTAYAKRQGDAMRLVVGGPRSDDGAAEAGSIWFVSDPPEKGEEQKISSLSGRFANGLIEPGDAFGSSIAYESCDVVGEGLNEIIVGAPGTDEMTGAIWLLNVRFDGTTAEVISRRKDGGSNPTDSHLKLEMGGLFGSSVTCFSDPGGPTFVAVGAEKGGNGSGAVFIFEATSQDSLKLVETIDHEDFRVDQLGSGDRFGAAVAAVDVDHDSHSDLVVGAPFTNHGATAAGAFRVVFLDEHGKLRSDRPPTRVTQSDVGGRADLSDHFGSSVSILATDGDSSIVAIGEPGANDKDGLVWIVSLDTFGKPTSGSTVHVDLHEDGEFGDAVVSLGDLNRSGSPDLAIGAPGRALTETGSFSLVFRGPEGNTLTDGTVSTSNLKFADPNTSHKRLGASLAASGDLNGNENPDLLVGWPGGGPEDREDRGALWVLFDIPVPSTIAALTDTVTKGAVNEIEVDVLGHTGLRDVKISVRAASENAGEGVRMQPQSNRRYLYPIASSLLSIHGLEYQVTATDSLGLVTRLPASGGYLSLPVANLDRTFPIPKSGTQLSDYRLISVPLDLNEKSAAEVFRDNLGEYDPTRWRFFAHVQDTLWNENDPQAPIMLEPGRAYWMITSDTTLVGTGPGTTLRTDRVRSIALTPGWNYIGNPFTYDIPLTNVQYKLQQGPVDARFFEGTWRQTWLDSTETLRVFQGIAVASDVPGDSLRINPVLPAPSAEPFSSSKSPRLDWKINVTATAGKLTDDDNLAGVTAERNASHRRDQFDRPEPPFLGRSLSLYFSHPDWESAFSKFDVDIQPTMATRWSWPIEVRTRSPERVTLSFDGVERLPGGYTAWLEDPATGLLRPVTDSEPVDVASSGHGNSSRLVLHVRSAADTYAGFEHEIPDQTSLLPVYPNPSNGLTTIRFDLKEPELVRIDVFNALGQKISTLVRDRRHAGRQAVVWDARDNGIPSGLYIVRMDAGSFHGTARTLIIR